MRRPTGMSAHVVGQRLGGNRNVEFHLLREQGLWDTLSPLCGFRSEFPNLDMIVILG